MNSYAFEELAAAEASPMIVQLRKLSGLPSRIATIANASKSMQSMPVIMKSPKSACAQKNGMLMSVYSAARQVLCMSVLVPANPHGLLTTTSVPMISFGGSMLELTMLLTKLAVMPTIAIIATSARHRRSRKDLASGAAPYVGRGMCSGQ